MDIAYQGIVFTYTYLLRSQSLCIFAMTLDSMFCSLEFMRSYIVSKINRTPHEPTVVVYDLSIIDRYIYYLGLDLIYRCLMFLIWGNGASILYICMSLSACPIILNFIAVKYLTNAFYLLNKAKNKFIKQILAQQVANIINYLSNITINLRPDVKSSELLPLFRDIDQITKFFWGFLTSFLIATLIQYTKNSGNKFYAKVIRYLYNYKTGDFIGGINDKKAREKFAHIIVYRKWDQLLLPDTLQSIFYIYRTNPEGDLLNQIYGQVSYMVINISSMWTCVKLFGYSSLSPIFGLLMILVTEFTTTNQSTSPILTQSLKSHNKWIEIASIDQKYLESYRNDVKTTYALNQDISKISEPHNGMIYNTIYSDLRNRTLQYSSYLASSNLFRRSVYQIVVLCISLIWFPSEYLLICIISECEQFLLTNRTLLSLYSYLGVNIKRLCQECLRYNDIDYRYSLILFVTMILGALSNYNIVHVCSLFFMTYVGLNIYALRSTGVTNIVDEGDTYMDNPLPEMGIKINSDTLEIHDGYFGLNGTKLNGNKLNNTQQETKRRLSEVQQDYRFKGSKIQIREDHFAESTFDNRAMLQAMTHSYSGTDEHEPLYTNINRMSESLPTDRS